MIDIDYPSGVLSVSTGLFSFMMVQINNLSVKENDSIQISVFSFLLQNPEILNDGRNFSFL